MRGAEKQIDYENSRRKYIMKDTNIKRIKAYVGKYPNQPYVFNELPISGKPSRSFNDNSVRSLITDDQCEKLIELLNHYDYITSPFRKDPAHEPWFFCAKRSWEFSYDDYSYMLFDIEIETAVTVLETTKDKESEDYIKVTKEDLARFLKQYKDQEKKNMEDFEKLCSGFFGI